jgi:hypothetical protein
MSKAKTRARERLGICPVTREHELDEDAVVTLTCTRTATHTGYHQDPNFGRWI